MRKRYWIFLRIIHRNISLQFSFECTECGKPYSSQDHVNRHYRTKHQLEKSSRLICTIDECTKTFVNKQNLDRHQRIAHRKMKPKPVKVN